MLLPNSRTAPTRTWSQRAKPTGDLPMVQTREHVYADPDGRTYLGDIVYVRRPNPNGPGSDYGWLREGLAYTNPKVLARLRLGTKSEAIAALLERTGR